MKLTISILFFLSVNNIMSQIDVQCDTSVTSNYEIKFEFEKWKGSGTKKLKAMRGITLDLKTEEGSHEVYGNLYEIDEMNITIVPLWETIFLDTTDNYNISTDIEYEDCITTIPIQNVESLYYDPGYLAIPATIGYTSLISALIVAPLVSIDRDSPNNFNSKRYKSIVIPSLVGIGVGFTCYLILNGGENRFRLKPKLVN